MRLSNHIAILAQILALLSCCDKCYCRAFRGFVVDENSKPVPAAKVQAVKDASYVLEEDAARLVETATDSKGAFTLTLESTEPLALVASAGGMRTARFPLPDSTPDKPLGLRLSPGARISGKVMSAEGKALAGVLLGPIVPAAAVDPAMASKSFPQWTRSSPTGSFEFDGLAPGMSYDFLASAEGYQTTLCRANAGQQDTPVLLAAGGSEFSVILHLPNFPTNYFVGAPVRATNSDLTLSVKLTTSGIARFRGVPPGTFDLAPVLPPPRFGRPTQVMLPQDSSTTITIPVSNGYYLRGICVDADTSIPAMGVGLKIQDEFTTTDESGKFVAGPLWLVGRPSIDVLEETGFRDAGLQDEFPAEIQYGDGFHDLEGIIVRVRAARSLDFDFGDSAGTFGTFAVHLLTSQTAERRFHISPENPRIDLYDVGDYTVFADDSSSSTTEMTNVGVRYQTHIPIRLTFGLAARCSGVVKAPGAETTLEVRMVSMDSTTSGVKVNETQCAPDGRFSFSLLPPGRYRVEAQAGNRLRSVEAQLERGENEPIEMSFEAGREFSGRVVSGEKQPVVAASLNCTVLRSDGSQRSILLETDTKGVFKEPDVEGERIVSVEVGQVGYVRKQIGPFELPAKEVEIKLEPMPALRVQVSGPPSSSWRIFLMETVASGAPPYPAQRMGREVMLEMVAGGVDMEFQPPRTGRYVAAAENADDSSLAVSQPFDWDVTTPRSVALQLKPGQKGTIRGSLPEKAPNNTEITAINTTLSERLETQFTAQAKSGRFEFANVPPGDYLITAIGDSFAAEAQNVEVQPGMTATAKLAERK